MGIFSHSGRQDQREISHLQSPVYSQLQNFPPQKVRLGGLDRASVQPLSTCAGSVHNTSLMQSLGARGAGDHVAQFDVARPLLKDGAN
jgi:hypothetical protein